MDNKIVEVLERDLVNSVDNECEDYVILEEGTDEEEVLEEVENNDNKQPTIFYFFCNYFSYFL